MVILQVILLWVVYIPALLALYSSIDYDNLFSHEFEKFSFSDFIREYIEHYLICLGVIFLPFILLFYHLYTDFIAKFKLKR